jgi:hypothetical protein
VNWRRLLLYLGYAVAVGVLTLEIVTGLAIGDCSLETVDCGEDRRRIAFGVLGAGVLALIFLLVRYVRDPGGRR